MNASSAAESFEWQRRLVSAVAAALALDLGRRINFAGCSRTANER